MSKRVHIICHANAGHGLGKKELLRVQEILARLNLNYIVYQTDYSTHAEVLTEQIIHRGYNEYNEFLMVIGGDGTLHEVVDAIVRNNLRIPLTYVPAGTGNDFYNTWQKGLSTEEIINRMLYAREPQEIPIFRFYEKFTNRKGIIVNNMGYGFDAEVNYAVNQKKGALYSFPGFKKLKYISSLFMSLGKLKAFEVSGKMDGLEFSEKNAYVAAILNSPFAGGGIALDGETKGTDESIALVIYHNVSFSNAPSILKALLIDKQPQKSPNVTRLVGDHLELKIHEPTIGHVDGEVISSIPADVTVWIDKYPMYL